MDDSRGLDRERVRASVHAHAPVSFQLIVLIVKLEDAQLNPIS